MSSLSLMEWNGKPPLPWDWDNLIMFHGTSENPKKLRATDWEFDGENGIDSGSFNSSGGGTGSGNGNGSGNGSGGSLSDLGLTCLSKSSKSASINSSSTGEVKTSKFTLEATEAIPEDFNTTKEFSKAKAKATVTTDTSPTPDASVGSGEPLLSLKLGKRTYFEDVCAGGNTKTSSFSVIPASSVTPAKRSKSSGQSTPASCCQVEGCTLDLSSAKDYHRKHRVCESHSKSPKVIIAGLERRFCQQCSRFHDLSEFDEKKRSCRRRLSDHNARRRKPQPGSVPLNPPRLSSSVYDGRQQMSLVWDGPVHARGNTNLTWEITSSSKLAVTKEHVMKPEKIKGIDGKLHLPGNHFTNSLPMDGHRSNDLLQSKAKGTKAEILNQGLEECVISSNEDATPDLRRALSLLSTSSWGSCEPKSVTFEQSMHTNHTSVSSSLLHSIPQGLPLSSSDYWRTEQQSTDSHLHNLTSQSDGNSFFQEFQLLRAPYQSDFYSSQMN